MVVGVMGVIIIGITYIYTTIRNNENTPSIAMPNNPVEDGLDHAADIARNIQRITKTTAISNNTAARDVLNEPTNTSSMDVVKKDYIVTTTANLGGAKAIKYTDTIGEFSITVPATWVVEYGINFDKNQYKNTYMVISEPILDTFRPFPKGFIIRATQLSFGSYLNADSSDLELPKLEFYNVYSYQFKKLPAIHWEQDTHIGTKYTTDFILRKHKKYNLAIEQNGDINDAELKQIINSLEL